MTDIPPEATFQLKYCSNVSERLAPELLEAIMAALPKTITYQGKDCRIKVLADVRKYDYGWGFVFDILDPVDGFDHVEFTVYKTGWGRFCAPPPEDNP